MICSHCGVGIKLNYDTTSTIQYVWDNEDANTGQGFELRYGLCPVCGELLVTLVKGSMFFDGSSIYLREYREEEIIYPKYKINKELPKEVQGNYRKDFMEAYQIVDTSPKASAAISRRLLQELLREEFKIVKNNLYLEIEEFIARKDVPSYLMESVDAVRIIGNFAAHPIKSTNSGQIVEVESGEAEWLLEVLEALFDFALVQPKKLEARKQALNEKLKQFGMKEMR